MNRRKLLAVTAGFISYLSVGLPTLSKELVHEYPHARLNELWDLMKDTKGTLEDKCDAVEKRFAVGILRFKSSNGDQAHSLGLDYLEIDTSSSIVHDERLLPCNQYATVQCLLVHFSGEREAYAGPSFICS